MSNYFNWPEIWYRILANVITLVLTLVVAWLLYAIFGRRSLLRFFGVDQTKNLRIYVGHIPKETTRGLVGFEEMGEAKNIEALFRSVIPGLGDQPGLLKFLQVADIQTEIMLGRREDPNVSLDQSLVSLGAPESNFASLLIEKDLNNPVKFDGEKRKISIPNLDSPIAENQAVVVKIFSRSRAYFYIAGTNEPATAAAARYLVQNWKAMLKAYGYEKSFYYLVQSNSDSRRGTILVANGRLRFPE